MNISKALCISAFMALLLGMSSQPGEYYGLLKIFILSITFFWLVVNLKNGNANRLANNLEVKNSQSRWLPISMAIFASFFLFFTFEFEMIAKADSKDIEIGQENDKPIIKKIEVEVGRTSASKIREKRVVVVGKINVYDGKEKEGNIIGEK